jgi:transcriptional regulator with XRE-family HTH domain
MKKRQSPLGKELKAIRDSQGVSLKRLSELVKRDRGYLSQIELGERKPSAKLLEDIANALDVNRNILLRHINLLKMEFTRSTIYEKGHGALNELDPEEVEKVLDYIDYLKYCREIKALNSYGPDPLVRVPSNSQNTLTLDPFPNYRK